ncbi:MAG TPA: YezD family protein [Ruminiclostridium sp.]|jgi:hypothetical protein|nr:YezD family protein [Ruminiclostridium sp.]
MANLFIQDSEDIIEKLVKNIRDIKYGSVTIIIQDGKIVQIERNEKVRMC